MGVKIVVDYENIPSKSKKIREYARQINGKLLDIYSQLEKMQNSWNGARYEELIKIYTSLIPVFNKSLEIVVTEIPYMFEVIANSFSTIDIQRKIIIAQRETPKKITAITKTKSKSLKYFGFLVEKDKKAILADFNEINNLLDNIGIIIGQIQIESDAMVEFKTSVKRFINEYKKLINTNSKKFSTIMDQIKNIIELAEKNNTIQPR